MPVKISNKGNSKGHKVFRLTTVLYVPDAPYNIVGGCWTGDWSSCSKDLRTLFLEDKEPIARIKDRGGFAVIRISGFPTGPKVGPSVLSSYIYDNSWVHWENAERRRYKHYELSAKLEEALERTRASLYMGLSRRYGDKSVDESKSRLEVEVEEEYEEEVEGDREEDFEADVEHEDEDIGHEDEDIGHEDEDEDVEAKDKEVPVVTQPHPSMTEANTNAVGRHEQSSSGVKEKALTITQPPPTLPTNTNASRTAEQPSSGNIINRKRKASEYLFSPYTPAERTWLVNKFGNEFKFLREHGLRIYHDDEREEGRALARTLMRDEHEEEDKQAVADVDAAGPPTPTDSGGEIEMVEARHLARPSVFGVKLEDGVHKFNTYRTPVQRRR